MRTFKSVDTCAAEFAAQTPYYYSGWERPGPSGADHEVDRGGRASVVILGSGPNRIGQGIEFDYCCVHAAQTIRETGRDAVMINCNPETVSTDYDTSNRLYFEPLTLEDVLGVCEIEKPEGVVVQFGGQTPLKLAAGLDAAGITILGTSIEAIDLAEDRSRFGPLLDRLGYKAPPYATADSPERALAQAPNVGFPLLVRPSYVLGGRAMEIVYSVDGLRDYLERVRPDPGATIYLDRFLEDSIEVDVDALCDGEDVWIAGIMQHVEEAGIHSGDSACVLPPHTLGHEILGQIRAHTEGIARALGVVGLLNVQYAIHGDDGLYVIEANPRASRTVPFVSKAIGLPLAKLACRIVLGERLAELALPRETGNGHVCVKEAVLPFDRFTGADSLLGPEMRSTGEVMGIARDFPTAFAKAQAAAGAHLPSSGTVFITVADGDKPAATGVATVLHDLGFRIIATRGTAQAIRRMGIAGRGDQQDRGGLAARGRLDRARRGRPRDQHSGRHRSPRRRVRDPHRRGRARNSLHHDHGRRDRRRARDLGRPPRRTRGALAPGDPRQDADLDVTADRAAPRRSAAAPPRSSRASGTAPTPCSAAPTPPDPGPAPGSSTCSRRRRGGAGERVSDRSSPARSACCGRRPAPTSSSSWSKTSARAPTASPSSSLAIDCCSWDRSATASGRPARGGAHCWSGGGVGIAPLAIWQDELGPATPGPARLPRRRSRVRRRPARRRHRRHRRRFRRSSWPGHRAARAGARR